MTEAWLSAFTTRNLVADRRNAWMTGNIECIENAIVDYARTVLVVRCQYMWDKILHDDGSVDTDETRYVNVPAWVWHLTDDLRLDWETGIFHLAGDRDGQTRYVKLQGVEFETAGVNRLWPDSSGETKDRARLDGAPPVDRESHAPTKSKTRPRKPVWNDWTAALTLLALDGEVTGSLTDTELMKLVNDRLAAWGVEEMPRSTAQSTIAAVLERLRSAGV